jgi:ATP-dependent Lhr-like helicase
MRGTPDAAPGAAPGRTVWGRRPGRIPRAWRERWREGPPLPGRWYSLETEEPEESALEREERNCGRVRLLLRRWGVLCRPLLETEPFFSWAALLPAMRRMELAGELVTGRFFAGIPSLQFASPGIGEELEAAEAALSGAPPYWMNAVDPASPAGWNIAGLPPGLPPRTATSRLCFRLGELAAVSARSGGDLTLTLSPDDPDLSSVLEFLSVPRKRSVHPVRSIRVERINGGTASESPYRGALEAAGFIADRGKLVLW